MRYWYERGHTAGKRKWSCYLCYFSGHPAIRCEFMQLLYESAIFTDESQGLSEPVSSRYERVSSRDEQETWAQYFFVTLLNFSVLL